MLREEILGKLKDAIIELEDEEVNRLLKEGLQAGLSPMEMITDGLSSGLTLIGEGFESGERFMSDLVIAGEIMTEATETLRPAIEAGGKPLGDIMVIGTVEGDQHNIGKRIVAAIFTGAGYKVIDIGENMAANAFVDATREYKPTIVGASAIIGPVKPYCKVINDALVDAGIRDDVIYIVGGWGMTQDWSDNVGADCYGEHSLDALHKVKMIRVGELPKLKDRLRK